MEWDVPRGKKRIKEKRQEAEEDGEKRGKGEILSERNKEKGRGGRSSKWGVIFEKYSVLVGGTETNEKKIPWQNTLTMVCRQ